MRTRAAVLALLCAADLLVMLDGMVVTVAGLVTSTAPLLAARAVQGLGAAFAVPAALALLAAAFRQGRERERAVGLLSAVLDVGMVAGLVLGGVPTASLGWPWCFFIVVPFGLAAGILLLGALSAVRRLPAGDPRLVPSP